MFALLALLCTFICVLFWLFRKTDNYVVVQKKREMGEFSREAVALHSTREDLWVIIEADGISKVYDLTSYVNEHPGGDAILTNAGGDSTEAFFGPQHPPRVFDLLDDFCIGTLTTSTSDLSVS